MSYNVEATVDGIKIHYDGGEVEVDYNASDGDVVRLTIEPLEVKVTDGFRAAVKKACNYDSSSGGGSGGGSTGGGVLVVHKSPVTNVLDKTWQEIHDAMLSGGAVIQTNETNVDTVGSVFAGKGGTYMVVSSGETYLASSVSGYPSSDGGAV